MAAIYHRLFLMFLLFGNSADDLAALCAKTVAADGCISSVTDSSVPGSSRVQTNARKTATPIHAVAPPRPASVLPLEQATVGLQRSTDPLYAFMSLQT